ncbi:hypothetical protein F2Q68_00039772 [Brassica cretica]|uniref:Uncharacterized protein n=1 Tax=Brassica cretica TaxID=69181 RepID=A0A8S9MIS8_BRACR|nr:hypothetical protein F2Q68_00039772 [Brassica cretica]
MEDMEFGRTSIDEMTATSSDKSTAKSIDAAHQTSIDDTPPEAGKFSLTNNANEGLVLGEPKGQLSNAINQIINKQGTEIPVKINLISKRDHETKLPLQDYLNPGRTYSNRSAIKLPKDDTKKSGVSLEYLVFRPNTSSTQSIRSVRVRAKAQSLHSDRTSIPLGCYVATKRSLGRYVATELEPELGRYVATELEPKLGRYVATELEPKLGRYVATELEPELGRYVATELEPKLGRYCEFRFPQLAAGKNILIAAYGNSLRSIIMYLDKLTCKEVISLELSTGIPLLYIFKDGKFMKRGSPVCPTEAGVYAYTKAKHRFYCSTIFIFFEFSVLDELT